MQIVHRTCSHLFFSHHNFTSGLHLLCSSLSRAIRNAYQELCPLFTLPLCLGKVQVPKAMVYISARREVVVVIDHRIIVVSEDGGVARQDVMLKYVEFTREIFTLVVVPGLGIFGK